MSIIALIGLLAQLGGEVATLFAKNKTDATKGNSTVDAVVAAANAAGLVASTIAKLQEEGRATTTEEEAAALNDVLSRRSAEDLRFDSDLPKPV